MKQYVIALLIASFLAISSLGIGITVITNASNIMEDNDTCDITVFKYYDVEGTGRYDEEVDSPIEGWYFELYGKGYSNGDDRDHPPWYYLANGTTDSDGYLVFEDWQCGSPPGPMGHYKVREYIPEGWYNTGSAVYATHLGLESDYLTSGSHEETNFAVTADNNGGDDRYAEDSFWLQWDMTVEFGNAMMNGNITVYKLYDMDESGLGGWTFHLWTADDGEADEYIGNGTTDQNGEYTFENLYPGDYIVVEELQDDWYNVSDLEQQVTVYPDETSYVWFSNAMEDGSITVYKFYDTEMTGDYDGETDEMLEGWTFHLWTSVDGEKVQYLGNGTTDGDGEFTFEDLYPGYYIVVEELPEGWENTTDLEQLVTVYPNVDSSLWFGNVEEDILGEITVYKFHDANYDGEYDTEEQLIDGFMFQLWYADEDGNPTQEIGEPVNTMEGMYTFEDLEPGNYVVQEIIPEVGEDECCWVSTTGELKHVEVKPEGTYVLYFGNVRGGNITGMKFLDIEADGHFDIGLDKPLAGWTIKLYEAVEEEILETHLAVQFEPELVPGDEIRSTITDELGEYKFECVAPGYYFVGEDIPEGWYNVTEKIQLVYVEPCTTTENVDFANCMYKDIYGIKFYDNSTSGTFEPEEGDYLIEGWKIILLAEDQEEVLETTYTLANGYYFFEGLKVGTYYVAEEVPEDQDPEGWVRTTPEEYPVRIELNCCTPCTIVNFGNYERPQITIRKFYDTTMSGDFQEGEGDFLMTEEFVFNVSKDGLFSETLGVTGEWTFYVDAGSNYAVEEILAPGWHNTTDLIQSTEHPLGPGDHVTFDFGNVRLGNIEVFKFHDLNMSGEYDEENEYGLEGWTFNLYEAMMQNDEPEMGDHITSETTNDTGYLIFSELEPGWYAVQEIVEDGWENTTDTLVFVYVPLEETIPVEFGNVELGNITVFKFHDKEVTGSYDCGDLPLARWNITLYNDENDLVDYGYTDEDGEITFEGLLPGEYYVNEHLWDCWMNTTELPVHVTLEAGGEERVEIGNAQYGWISGYKYCGYEDFIGEPIAGWEIYLYQDGTRINETVTNETGYYEFTCLAPGTYTVKEESPEDWYHYTPDNVTVYIGLETHEEVYFYNYRHADIWGMKYCDFNMNGEFDECLDWPIYDWEIQLWYADEDGNKMGCDPIEVAYTDNWGMYRFEDLAPGHYLVKEVLGPCGWMNTTDSEVHVHITGCMEYEEVNFGNYRQSDISVKAYDYEMNEPVAGLALYLWEADEYGLPLGDEPIAEGVTGEHGYYIFGKYDPGYYVIETEDEQSFHVTLRCCTAYVIIEYYDYNNDTPRNDAGLATYVKIE